MTKFDRIARSLLNEEADQRQNIYRQISDLLSAKGIKAFEQDEILKTIQNAMHQAYKEGYKAGGENPFK